MKYISNLFTQNFSKMILEQAWGWPWLKFQAVPVPPHCCLNLMKLLLEMCHQIQITYHTNPSHKSHKYQIWCSIDLSCKISHWQNKSWETFYARQKRRDFFSKVHWKDKSLWFFQFLAPEHLLAREFLRCGDLCKSSHNAPHL